LSNFKSWFPNIYFETEKGVIINDDCFNVFKYIPDKSIDTILADLPYGITECKWDSVLPLDKLWEEYRRIIKDNGAILLFGTEPFSTFLRIQAIDLYKYDWIWQKTVPTGFQHAKNMPLRDYEIISVFSKAPIGHKSLLGDKRMKYNPQGLQDCFEIENSKTKFKNIISERPSHKDIIIRQKCNYPKMIIKFPNQSGECANNKRLHPTQKPVALLEYLIKTYTNEGDLVLDNTAGVCSTGVAAENTNRYWICIEKELEYCQKAVTRFSK